MKRIWIVFLVAGAAILAVSAYQYLTRPGRGDLVPAFNLPAVDGQTISSEQFQGAPLLVHFWASWCGPCRQEFASLSRLYRDFKDDGFLIIAISEDGKEGDEAVRSFLKLHPVSFPVLLDRQGRVADAFRSWGVPESILVDRQGVIAWRGAGARDWDSHQARDMVRELVNRNIPADK
jgi:peroxiredoxin